MKIISYNVNGIRAAMQKNLLEWLKDEKPDVVCLQEIKATEDQIDVESIKMAGYNYNYFHPAQKKGYSGVAILSKIQPINVEIGTGINFIDDEGRVIRADFQDYSVISLYLPSGTNMDRLGFKMEFCAQFLNYIKELKKNYPNLIILGDYNICHKEIDIHDPIRNANVSGFLPEEREWLSKFIDDCQMIDSFRYMNSEPHRYSWWSYRAGSRDRNKGWRIDYAMVSKSLESKIKKADILHDVKHSDHCPILVEI